MKEECIIDEYIKEIKRMLPNCDDLEALKRIYTILLENQK